MRLRILSARWLSSPSSPPVVVHFCLERTMCTCILHNGAKTIVGFNFDNPGWKYKIVQKPTGVYVALQVGPHRFSPMFGVSKNGNFVNAPTLWPERVDARYRRGDAKHKYVYLDRINHSLLKDEMTLKEAQALVERYPLLNEPKVNLQCQDSDRFGNVLQLFPGVKPYFRYLEKPRYSVLSNFQTLEPDKEIHPWSGRDRYAIAVAMLEKATDGFDVNDAFRVLSAVKQTILACPTDVSLVYDANDNVMYWAEHMDYATIHSYQLGRI